MSTYRFSPIHDQEQLMRAIQHIHVACHVLCKHTMEKCLPVAGNIGVFCHFDDEYEFLKKPQVGDIDFYLEPEKYSALKQSLLGGKIIKGARVLPNRPDLDLVELYDPDIDAWGFIGNKKWE